MRKLLTGAVALLAAMTITAAPSEARVYVPHSVQNPILYAIHHWVRATHHFQTEVGQPKSPYNHLAERTHSTALRLWIRHRWYHRAMRAAKLAHATPTQIIWAVWAPVVGPAEAAMAVHVASCESGLRPDAYNPSSATGLFQILGGPFNPWENTRLALRMYQSRGWEPWTASESCWG